MADRVNTKFVIGLSAVLVLLTGMLFVVWYFGVHARSSPEKLVRQGDAFVTQGMFEEAIGQYGKAIRKRPDDISVLFKYVDALEQIKTDEPLAARNYIRQIGGALSQVVTQEPQNQVAFERVMKMYMRIGRELGDFSQWNIIYDMSDARIKGGLDTPLVRKFRGIAQVFRMENLNLTEDQREQALEDLTAAHSEFPDERDPVYYLAAWHMMEAKNLERTIAGTERVASHRNQAKGLIDQMIEAHPDDTRLRVDRLRILGMMKVPDHDHISGVVEQVELRLVADPTDPRLVLEAARLIPLLDRKPVPVDEDYPTATTAGLRRAERMLRSAIGVHEDNPHLLFALGEVLRRQRRTQQALPMFLQVFETLALTDPFETLVLDQLKVQAKVRYADLLLETAKDGDTSNREKILAQVKPLIEDVASEYGDNPQVNLVQGKIALLEKQWSMALTKLDQANAGFKDSNPEALLLSAQVRSQLGELGAATQRLERLVLIRPDFVPARYDLTNNYLRFGELPKAKQQIEKILESDPNDPWGMYYQARLLTRRGMLDLAIEQYESIDSSKIPDVPVQLARLYIAKGKPESAKQTLLAHFEINAKDTVALQLLVKLSGDIDEAKGYINASRQAGVSEKALSLLERQIEGTVDVTELIDKIAEESDTPMGLHLTRYRLYRQMGRLKKARAELDQARTIDPDHPVVVSAFFGIALEARDWDQAQSIADQAAAQNLDEAQGMFYYGRLEVDRGDHDHAISTLRRGLKLRPVYSEGWRLLGDALRGSADLEGAVDAYKRAVSQRPNNTSALAGLARVFDVQGEHVLALQNLRKAVQFRPRDRSLRGEYLDYEQRHGDRQRALALRQRAVEIDPQDTSNIRALALLLVDLERGDDALRLVDRLIQTTGNQRLNVATRAQIYTSMGDNDRAIQVIKEYVYEQGDKANAGDWMLFARHLNKIGDRNKAHAAYRQAIQVEEQQTRIATREFADLLFDQQQIKKSLPHYKVLLAAYPDERRVGLRYAEALLRDGQPELAAEVLGQVNQQHDADGTSLVLEAIIMNSLDKPELALELLNKAAELEPLNAMVRYRRGQLMVTEPAMESAVIADLRRSVELDPDMTSSRELLASVHLRRGERNEAVRELESVIQRKPERASTRLRLAEIYRQEGDTVLLRKLLQDSQELFPNSPVWPQLQGHLEYAEGNVPLGIEKLQQAFTLSPSPKLLGEVVQMLIDSDQTDGALEMLNQNSGAVSRVPYLQALHGQALTAADQTAKAELVFAGAINQSEVFEQMAGVLGVMATAIGEQRAIAVLEPMARGNRRGLIELAMAQVQISNHQFQATRDRLEQINQIIRQGTAERVVFDRLLGLSLQQLGRPDEAFEAYQRVLATRPNDLITLNNTAYLLVDQLDRADDAVRLAQRAATMSPNNPLVLDTLGWSLFKTGETQRALQVLRRSVKLDRTGPNCLHLAEVLLKRGDMSDAVDMFTNAKEIAESQNDQDILLVADQRLRELTQ